MILPLLFFPELMVTITALFVIYLFDVPKVHPGHPG